MLGVSTSSLCSFLAPTFPVQTWQAGEVGVAGHFARHNVAEGDNGGHGDVSMPVLVAWETPLKHNHAHRERAYQPKVMNYVPSPFPTPSHIAHQLCTTHVGFGIHL